MKQILHFTAAIALLALLACTKQQSPDPAPSTPDARPRTFTATFETPTRADMYDNGVSAIEVRWNSYDNLYVVTSLDNTKQTPYVFTIESISADGKTAVFKAPADFPADAVPACAIHTTAWYLQSDYNPANLMPLLGDLVRSKVESYCYPYFAVYDAQNERFEFKPFMGILRLGLTVPAEAANSLKKVSVTTEDGTSVFYTSGYNITDGTVRYNSAAPNRSILSIGGTFAVPADRIVTFYALTGPTDATAGKKLLIHITDSNGKVFTATQTGGRIEAGKCYPLDKSVWTDTTPAVE